MSDSAGIAAWLGQYPEIITILVVAAGWILAILLRRGVTFAILRLNQISMKWGSRAEPAVSSRVTAFLRSFIFWAVLVTAILFGISLLGGGQVTTWIGTSWGFITRLVVALAILITGHVVGLVARRLVSSLARKPEAPALSRLSYAIIMGIAAITAIDQLGLNLSFLTQLSLALITVFFLGLSLAFGAGAKTLVANLLAQGELARYHVGDRIRVGHTEGKVVEIQSTGLVLSTTEGFARIPAAKFAENTIVVLGNDVAEDG